MIPSPADRDRGQMAPLGVALLFGIVIIGTVGIVVLGGAALDDTQGQSQLQRSEHVLTLFDSRTAMVALGDSSSQQTTLAGTGTYDVKSDAGRIRIRHFSYNETNAPNHETVYNKSMGALVYRQGNKRIAYEGGGVWRKDRAGNATMITPPEFYFRQSTLTFPLIRIANSDSAAGSVTARVTATQRAEAIYPNRTAKADAAEDGNPEDGAPYDPVSGYEEPYSNPMENGTLIVFVQSDYYRGWAEYFRTRTDARVTTFDSNETVKANLISIGKRGKFDMPEDGNGITVRGLEGGDHNLNNFTVVLLDDAKTEADFSNLKWSMVETRGQKQIELHIRHKGSVNHGDPVEVYVYYSDDGGNSWHGWKNESFGEIQVGDFDDDGEDEKRVGVDFTSDASMEYTDKIKTNVFDAKTGDHDNPITWDAHSGSVSWEPRDYDKDGSSGRVGETLFNVTAHYFELMGEEFTLEVNDNPSNGQGSDSTVNEGASFGRIEYPGSSKYIAYLHVTENEVTVELED